MGVSSPVSRRVDRVDFSPLGGVSGRVSPSIGVVRCGLLPLPCWRRQVVAGCASPFCGSGVLVLADLLIRRGLISAWSLMRRRRSARRVLSSGLFFVVARCALALQRRIWRWCGLVTAVLAGCCGCLYRSFFGISEVCVDFWCAALAFPADHGGLGWSGFVCVLCFLSILLRLALAGRGGEGTRCDKGGAATAAPAGQARVQHREWWRSGGCGKKKPWPCSLIVLRFRCLHRAAPAAFFMSGLSSFREWWCSGFFVSGGSAAVKIFPRLSGGSAFLRRCAVFLCPVRLRIPVLYLLSVL